MLKDKYKVKKKELSQEDIIFNAKEFETDI